MSHVEGMDRLETTLSRHFYNPKLKNIAKDMVANCKACQKNKRGSKAYGKLSTREAPLLPWHEIHCDTIGPWQVELCSNFRI